jgi:hypothetical protein
MTLEQPLAATAQQTTPASGKVFIKFIIIIPSAPAEA